MSSDEVPFFPVISNTVTYSHLQASQKHRCTWTRGPPPFTTHAQCGTLDRVYALTELHAKTTDKFSLTVGEPPRTAT